MSESDSETKQTQPPGKNVENSLETFRMTIKAGGSHFYIGFQSNLVKSSLSPALTSAGINKSKTDAAKSEQTSQDHSSSETMRAATTTPHPEVSAPPRLTPHARTMGIDGKGGPIAIPKHKNDQFIVSEYGTTA